MCTLCDSLDDQNLFQEEFRQFSWLSEDIAVLYEENRRVIEKIKSLNVEFENLAEVSECEETSTRDPEDDAWDNLENEDAVDEKNFWQAKEEAIRWILALQIRQLCADASSCHLPLQSLHLHQRHNAPVVPHHLWGHRTVRWRPQHNSQGSAARRKARRPGKLLKWLMKRMPQPTTLTI